MSDFLAEAKVLISPDTSLFRAQLLADIRKAAASIPPVPISLAVTGAATGAAAGVATAAAATEVLGAAQAKLNTLGLGLTATEADLTRAFGAQAVILEGLGAATRQAAIDQALLDAQSTRTTASLLGLQGASGKLNAALLGLRTAVGSSAVIGLGAGALAAIALGNALRQVVGTAATFEQQMNLLGATTGATASQIAVASEAAKQLGADATLPAVSATDAAQAITELSKAGLDLQNSISGARGVLQLATAASIENAAAVELAANALNAFGLAGDDATHVADAFANAANAAQGSISDIGIALQQSAAAASQVGISFEDTVSLLTILARNGLRASDAGTSLRVLLLRLAAPTQAATEILRAFNIQLRDVAGNIRPEAIIEFGDAAAQLPPQLRDAAAAAVFGQDAFRAFSLIAREGAAGLEEARQQIEKSGTAAEVAAAKNAGLRGAFDRLKSGASTFAQSLGEDVNPFLQSLVESAAVSVEGLNELEAALSRVGKQTPFQDLDFAGVVQRFSDVSSAADALRKQDVAFQPSFKKELEDIGTELTSRTSPALKATATDLEGYSHAVVDSVERTSEFTFGLSKFLASDLADAGSRVHAIGVGIGKDFGDGLKEGLDQSVIDAINSAKQNLLSLGANLGDQVSQLIDAGPLGQQLDRLQESLATRQRTRQRLALIDDLEDAQRQLKLAQVDAGALSQQLKRLQTQLDALRQADARAGAASTLRQAQAELREARDAIQGGAGDTARQRRDISEFLEPFKEQVRSARSTLQQQNLEGRIDKLNQKLTARKELFTEDEVTTAKRRVAAIQQAIKDFDDQAIIADLQKMIAAQKKAVQDGIANLIAQFEAGQINFAQFAARLGKLTGPYRKAGTDLGIAFSAAFQKQIDTVLDQAKQVAIGFAQPGGAAQRSAPAPTVVSVQDALLKAQQDTATNTDNIVEQIKLLRQDIKNASKPQPPGKPTPGAAGSPR